MDIHTSSVLAGGASGPSRSFSFPRLRAIRSGILEAELNRRLAVRYAWAHLNQPYRWGGDDPIEGFDCSGLVVEILTAVGIFPHRYDATAGGIYAELERRGCQRLESPQAGAVIVYYDKSGACVHTEIAIDQLHTLGASGGGSATQDAEDAAEQNAFVKIRPWNYRGQAAKIIDPFSQGGPAMKSAKIKVKAKAAAGDIAAIIAALIGFLPGLLKKKPYTLWQWDQIRKTWIDHGTYSARSCRKIRAELIKIGQDPTTFWIARKGVKPPAEGPK